MKTRVLSPFEWFVLINIIIAWFVGGKTMADNEKVSSYVRADEVTVEQLSQFHDQGKRFTYCDQLRHLVEGHGYDRKILNECINAPITEFDKLRFSGSAY